MPDPAQTDPRPPAADGERDLPEEIASAIEALVNAIGYAASDDGVFLEDMNCDEARSALTTSILSRLTAAEAGREEARADQKAAEDQNDALHVKLKALAPHGSCACSYDQPGDLCMHHSPALVAALARVEKLENALAGAVNRLNSGKSAASDWLYVVSEAGDLEVEMPSGFVAEPHAALTEAQPKGDQ